MDIDKIVRQAEIKLSRDFLKRLPQENLILMRSYLFSKFSVSFKKKEYQYEVYVKFKIMSDDHTKHEEKLDAENDTIKADVDRLILNSYKGKLLYKALLPFFPLDAKIDLLKDMEENDILALDVNNLELNDHFDEDFSEQTDSSEN